MKSAFLIAKWDGTTEPVQGESCGPFFVHRGVMPYQKKWVLSHKKTGFWVTQTDTKQRAIAAAKSLRMLPVGWDSITLDSFDRMTPRILQKARRICDGARGIAKPRRRA